MKCPYCGTDNASSDQFCSNCGGYLRASNVSKIDENSASSSPIVSSTASSTSTSDSITGSGESQGTSTLIPGVQLQNGRYIVEKMLGQGGMGAAVLAYDTRISNKPVVIKELISENTDPEQRQEDVRNFEREVALLAHVDHPLIPTVTDSFQEGSRYYMVQEYVPGENLEKRLEREQRPLPEQEVLCYASQVLTILDYLAHLQPPIVHRDIKPANIIISSKDHMAHLVDFGIARLDETQKSRRKQTSALGTPGYAPPEQYQGNADARSDIYALAATLHHLLTNRDPADYPPFNYPDVRTLNPALSAETERILEHALRIDIKQRYQTAVDMRSDVEEVLHDQFGEIDHSSDVYTRGYSGTRNTAPQPAIHPTSAAGQTTGSQRPTGATGRTGRHTGSHSSIRSQATPSRPQPSYFDPDYDGYQQRPDRIYDRQESRQQQQMEMMEPEPEYQEPSMNPYYQQQTAPSLGTGMRIPATFIFLLVVVGLIALLLIYLANTSGPGSTF